MAEEEQQQQQQQQQEQSPKTYSIKVQMSCGGCSGAVGRALTRKGIKFVEPIDLEKQQVEIYENDDFSRAQVIDIIKGTGKKVIEEEKEEKKE